MSVLVQARIDPKIKEEASAVLEDMGLSVSDAVRLMLVKTAKEKTLPFEIWRKSVILSYSANERIGNIL